MSEIAGAALETIVLQDVIAINDYCDLSYKIHYWRTVGGSEVDFILLGTKRLLGIEVKHSSRVSVHDIKSLKAFKEDYPEADLFLLYLGSQKQNIQDVSVLPVTEFLVNIKKYLS